MTQRTEAPGADQPIYFCGVVSATRRPTLHAVIKELQQRHPRASGQQLHDLIIDAGIVSYAKALGVNKAQLPTKVPA